MLVFGPQTDERLFFNAKQIFGSLPVARRKEKEAAPVKEGGLKPSR
jgi:hypothetical protein